jgi:hypothetical protein
MADTAITFQSKLQFTKNNQTYTNAQQQTVVSSSAAAAAGHHTTQEVGLTSEEVSLGDVDVSVEYGLRLQNHSTVNFVDVFLRKDVTPTDVWAGRMRPHEPFGPLRAPPQTAGYPHYRLLADTASCDVEVVAFDAGVPAA